MIEGFELQTEQLSDFEQLSVPIVVEILRRTSEENPIKNRELCREVGVFLNKPFTEARLRKIIQHIRCEKLLKTICATSDGYWWEQDIARAERYVFAYLDRCKSMIGTYNKLYESVAEMKTEHRRKFEQQKQLTLL